MTYSLDNGPENASHRIILAHGAGAGITFPFLEAMASLLAVRGLAVTRFEFAYMAQRRDGGKKRPPPKVDVLAQEYAAMIAAVTARKADRQRLVIGGGEPGREGGLESLEPGAKPGDLGGLGAEEFLPGLGSQHPAEGVHPLERVS